MGILVALFLTPYVIHHIGIERFGIWAIVGAVTGYFGLFDFGIGTSFVKYIAEFYANKEFKKINEVVNTGFVFYSMFAIIIIALAFIFIKPLLSFFKIPPYLYSETVFVFLAGVILFGISNVLSAFVVIQPGLQRMDITNKVAIVLSIPTIAGTFFFLEKGYGLPGLMINNIIMFVISGVINIVISFKILPELRFNPFLQNKKMFKKLFTFGYKLQIVKMSSFAGSQTDKLLITYFLSLGSVTFYYLGNTIVEKAKDVSLLITSALLPAISELDAGRKMDKIALLYFRSIKYVTLIALPLIFFLFTDARLIILTWMNQDFEKAVLALQILSVGIFTNILTGPAAVTVQGIGKPEYNMRVSLLHLFLNLFLSITLIIKFGFVGVLIGTSLSCFLTGGYFIFLVNRLLKISSVEFCKIILQPLLACLLAAFFIHLLNIPFAPSGLAVDRLANLGILVRNGLAFGVIIIAILWVTRYFNEEDVSLAKSLFTQVSYGIKGLKGGNSRRDDKINGKDLQ